MPVCNIGTAENLFRSLETVLSERNIEWQKVVAFNSDNASVMKGRHNSVASRIKAVQPGLIDVGCICHLVQLATGCGVKALRQPIEEDISFKDTSLQLENDDLCLGEEAQMFLEDNIDELSSSVPELLKAVRDFFVAVTTKMMSAFPLDNIMLQNLTALDPASRHQFAPKSVIELGKGLPQLSLDMASLREEVVEYQPGGDFSSAPDYSVSLVDDPRTATLSGASASYAHPLLSSPCTLVIS
ncbi:unnamed protein product [Gadus morhua 'NCC']